MEDAAGAGGGDAGLDEELAAGGDADGVGHPFTGRSVGDSEAAAAVEGCGNVDAFARLLRQAYGLQVTDNGSQVTVGG